MVDLGKYATVVLSSYWISLSLLFVFVAASIWRARSVKNQLDTLEKRLRSDEKK